MGVQLPGEKDSDVEVFTWLKDNCALRPSGRRTNLSRFCAAPYALVQHNKARSIEQFEVACCCLEHDFLGSRKLVKVILDKESKNKKDDDKVPMKEPAADEQAIRAVSRNAPRRRFPNGTLKYL